MQYRHFKKLNLDISLLGFGCMRFPTNADGSIDETHSQVMIDYAYEAGVNYFDTAWMYHGIGVSETFVGKALAKYPRDSFYLADKFPIWEVKEESDIERIFNTQLERLNMDYIDFYLIHALNKDNWEKVLKFNVLAYLEKWKAEGKIKHIGFSFHDDLDAFKTIVDGYDHWEFCQIQLNYIDTEHQQGMEGYEILAQKEIPCLIMEPLKGGALSNLPEEVKQPLTKLEPETSSSAWALRYVANLDNVHIILSGMSHLDHVKDNINTINGFKPLASHELDAIDKVKSIIENRVKVACTGCNYCMPCPVGVNIPENFKVLNNYAMYENKGATKWAFSELVKKNADASVCVECGACETHCPQQLSIIEDLKMVNNSLTALA